MAGSLCARVRERVRSQGVAPVAIQCSDRTSRVSRAGSHACTRVVCVARALAAIVLVLGACTTADTDQTDAAALSSPTSALPPPPPQPGELEWERTTDGAVTRPTVRQPEVDDATVSPKINDICPLPAGGSIAVGGHGNDGAEPAVWLTEDGESWGGFNALNRCDSDGVRAYVVGSHGSPHSAAVWTTTDGRNFDRLDHGAFPEFTSASDIEVFADGRVWIVGPIWAPEGEGASTIVEVDDTGAILQLERLDSPEFMSPTGFANIWSIDASADNIILLGDLDESTAEWRAPLS